MRGKVEHLLLVEAMERVVKLVVFAMVEPDVDEMVGKVVFVL